MINKEKQWDKLLNIKTSGRDDTKADQYHYPYEPTPYAVLERLAAQGYIGKEQVVVDYGCGKGRVEFFLAYQTKCKVIGIEYDERMIKKALENHKEACSSGRVTFLFENAEEYIVDKDADRFYFFNPFSVTLLRSVIGRIRHSYYENPREMLLFFYYPSDEYIAYLMSIDELTFVDEIDCKDLFPENNIREEILVFQFGMA